jgi:hypothetical protein
MIVGLEGHVGRTQDLVMSTLNEDLRSMKTEIAAGNVEIAAGLLTVYVKLKPSLARFARARIPAMIFNNHPRFTLGSRLLQWPEDERETWARQIERTADRPDRLAGVVDLAATNAEQALTSKPDEH